MSFRDGVRAVPADRRWGAPPQNPGPIEVREASPADRELIKNLYPLYLHDLSAFTDFYDVDDRGVFFPDYLSEWLDRPSPLLHPLVFREGSRPAGFALVGQAPYPHMSSGRDYRMCEFFVLNRSRRRGVGRRAARAVFGMFPGVWEVTQLPRNVGAVAFWRRVIGEHTGGAFSDAFVRDEVVQVFEARAGSV
jgi:predicted acetyltransferase